MARPKSDGVQPNESVYLESAPLEASAPLESSMPLDYEVVNTQPINPETQQKNAKMSILAPEVAPPTMPKNTVEQAVNPQLAATTDQSFVEQHPQCQASSSEQFQPLSATDVVKHETIRLLEERLVVDRKQRKVGDVIIRKEIETRMVEVPVRREKLIVEQISPEHKQLAAIDLGAGTIDSVELTEAINPAQVFVINAEFASAKAASQFLATIATQPQSEHQQVQIQIQVDNVEQQAIYQQWIERYSANQNLTDQAGA